MEVTNPSVRVVIENLSPEKEKEILLWVQTEGTKFCAGNFLKCYRKADQRKGGFGTVTLEINTNPPGQIPNQELQDVWSIFSEVMGETLFLRGPLPTLEKKLTGGLGWEHMVE